MDHTVRLALAATALAAAGLTAATESRAMAAQGEGESDADELPFAQGRRFATLDEYLAHLRRRGAYDVPWWREIRPGVYELVSRRGPDAPPLIQTREQLMERFGFTR